MQLAADARRALIEAARAGLSVRRALHLDPVGGPPRPCWHVVRLVKEPRAKGGHRWQQRALEGCHATVGQAVDALLVALAGEER